MSTATAKAVTCLSCGASITLRALGQTVMIACPSCGTQIDVSRPEIRIIQQHKLQSQSLRVPLGTRGKLRGELFEVIGAMRRGDKDGDWEEYLLFNPYIGFRWLVYDTGHWNLGRVVRDTSKISMNLGVYYKGQAVRQFHHGNVQVRWVVGEFYWRVKTGDQVEATDYAHAPIMLSKEETDDEITWTLLDYLEPEEVESAFKVSSPPRQWLAPNQPNPAQLQWQAVKPIAIVALIAALLIQFATAFHAQSRLMPVGSYNVAELKGESQIYGPFEFEASGSANELSASAQLNNSWVELQCSLVNVKTGQSFDFDNSFSYYSGHDSDGYWTEGSMDGTSTITGIPAGTYKLIVAGGGTDQAGQPVSAPITMSLRHDVAPWGNFWLAVLAMLIYPGYLLYRRLNYERERWN